MENKFSWKILAKKVIYSLIEIVIAGVVTLYSKNPYWMLLVPVLEGLRNYVKHS